MPVNFTKVFSKKNDKQKSPLKFNVEVSILEFFLNFKIGQRQFV